jgi:hypothetical protein
MITLFSCTCNLFVNQLAKLCIPIQRYLESLARGCGFDRVERNELEVGRAAVALGGDWGGMVDVYDRFRFFFSTR